MIIYLVPAITAALFFFIMGITIGHSKSIIKIRQEENRKKEIEANLLKERNEIIKAKQKISENIDELIFRAKVHNEIENITKNS